MFGVKTMSTLVKQPPFELSQPATNVCTRRVSRVDLWIGSRVRIAAFERARALVFYSGLLT
jgi:hypothetical protein